MRCSATTPPSPVIWRTNRTSVRSRSHGTRLRKRSSRKFPYKARGGTMPRNSGAGKNRRIIRVLLGFLVLNVFAVAQDLPAGKPESLGLSSERLESIGTAVQHAIDNKRIAGEVTL